MVKIVGVRFKRVGKIYYFDPADLELSAGQFVIVETSRGMEYGQVVIGEREVSEEAIVAPLLKVIRIATEEDQKQNEKNKEKEKEAIAICNEKIKKHELEMKLVDVEYTFDNSKIMFYFTAEGRVDFRELVKDLACVFRTRIELRQIGVRDETKHIGGMGICGRDLCCHSWLPDFIPVSIKMAKDQNLPLNPTKISGVCGRLMCCLKNEEETYEYLNSKLPRLGDVVEDKEGIRGEVISVNVLRQLVKVVLNIGKEEKEVREFKTDDLKVLFNKKRNDNYYANAEGCDAEELKELKELEKSEYKDKSIKENGKKDSERKHERGAERSQERKQDRFAGRDFEKKQEKNADHGFEKKQEKNADRDFEKKPDRNADRGFEKKQEKNTDRSLDKKQNRKENHPNIKDGQKGKSNGGNSGNKPEKNRKN